MWILWFSRVCSQLLLSDGMPAQSSARNLLSVPAWCINPLCPVRVVTWLKECVWWRTWASQEGFGTDRQRQCCCPISETMIINPASQNPKHSEVHHSRTTGLFNLTWKRQISLILSLVLCSELMRSTIKSRDLYKNTLSSHQIPPRSNDLSCFTFISQLYKTHSFHSSILGLYDNFWFSYVLFWVGRF